MTYHIDLTDARNQILKTMLEQNKLLTEQFSFEDTTKIEIGDVLIFSPAKKWSDQEINQLPQKVSLYSGKINDQHARVLQEKQIAYHNLMEDEIFVIKNANLTAEGVLALIIENSPKSIFENNVLILGAGRIAKALSIYLGRLGVKNSMVRFNKEKFPECFTFCETCYYGETFLNHLYKYDVIVNTIPNLLFDEQNFGKIARDTLYIETASTPSIKQELTTHINFVPAPALPQKFSKVSAAKLLYQNILGENNYV